jgi:hypothetical protein
MAWLIAFAYVVTIGCFVAAAWIAGAAGICDTCQGQDYALARYSIRRRR